MLRLSFKYDRKLPGLLRRVLRRFGQGALPGYRRRSSPRPRQDRLPADLRR
jgi:hypothetical protein